MSEIDPRTNEELLLRNLSPCMTVEKDLAESVATLNLDTNVDIGEVVGVLEYYGVPADKVNDLWIHFTAQDISENFGHDEPVRGHFTPSTSANKKALSANKKALEKLIPGIDEESLNNKCFILIDVPNCIAHQATLPAGHPYAIADTITHEVMHYIDHYKAEMAKKRVKVAGRMSFLSLSTTAALLVPGMLDHDHSELYTVGSYTSFVVGALALSYSLIKGFKIDSQTRQSEPSVLHKTAYHMENGLVGSRVVL